MLANCASSCSRFMEGPSVIHKLAVLVCELGRKETRAIQPGQENAVALPQLQLEQGVVIDPLQESLGRIDQLALEFVHYKNEGVPVLHAVEIGKGQDPFQPW